jgi:7-cyano-7-deazaguanine synthase in queuosine biosynthesis
MDGFCLVRIEISARDKVMAQYFVYWETDESAPGIHLQAGRDMFWGDEDFRAAFDDVTSLERDLLLLGASIFAADRGTLRGEHEDFARSIDVSVPVINAGALQPCVEDIERVLRTLSNDSWRITLRQYDGTVDRGLKVEESEGGVLLFSGGIDSLAAAVEFGPSHKLVLVSHVTRAQQTRNVQLRLVKLLESQGMALPHHQFFVSSRSTPAFAHDVESSQRTRSFMFLILAALVARRQGRRKLLTMAENGQMAIHLPLNAARIGSYSTHTAHPDVLRTLEGILSRVLGIPFTISNPYVACTKAEVVSRIWTTVQEAVFIANSCWRSARLPAGATHCGECVPCMVRRIAIETHGTDATPYSRNSFSEVFTAMGSDDEARRNLADLCEFTKRFETLSNADLFDEWPELYSENIDASATIEMYRRAASQTRTVLSRYPGLSAALA